MANKLIIVKDGTESQVELNSIQGLNLTFTENADNNIIKIHAPYKFEKASFMVCGSDNTIEIGQKSEIRTLSVLVSIEMNGCNLKIGENFFCVGCEIYLVTKQSSISIGNDCLISADVIISSDDGHPVFDIYTHEMLNKGGKVNISDHVWLGYGVTVCKNISIAQNVIVGANSIVTKNLDCSNAVYAGVPAKLKKTDVNFTKAVISRYEEAKRK